MMGGTSNRNPDVDAWLERYENPQRELVVKIRESSWALTRL